MTYEAKYIAASSCVGDAIWMRKLLKMMHIPQDKAITIFVDNKFAISLGKNLIFHDQSKHMDAISFYQGLHRKEGNGVDLCEDQ